MRIIRTMTAGFMCCLGGVSGAISAEEHLGLRGQLYFDSVSTSKVAHSSIPRHIPAEHVARAPIDFSYPETAASTGAHIAHKETQHPREESAWHLDISDGAKLRFAYDKDTKIKVGMGLWKVKVGISKAFGGPNSGTWELPVRHSRAAALGRTGDSGREHPSN